MKTTSSKNKTTLANTSIINQAFEKAIEVLESCARQVGFYASGLPGGYEAVWARDSMIASLGASLVGTKFKTAIKNSLDLLSQHQSELGQIPNCVGSYNIERCSKITFNTIDSTLWYIIGHYNYAQSYNDTSLLEKYADNIARAITWLKHQDPNEDKLLTQLPTMDWQDAFPHKYGRTINTNALYYYVLNLIGETDLAAYIKRIINSQIQKYLSLYDEARGYYLPWIWKDHDGDREQEEWFDSLGNMLSIVFGLANHKIANNILDYIEKEKINHPAALKAIWPPIKPASKYWHSYFSKCDARQPFKYLNAGIWPFIGGFYVTALVRAGRKQQACRELEKLARANMQKLRGYEFNEWLDGRTGKPKGEPYQAWSAGTYIYAYCIIQECNLSN